MSDGRVTAAMIGTLDVNNIRPLPDYRRATITTVYADGYSWVQVDDRFWSTAEFTDYYLGTPIYVRR